MPNYLTPPDRYLGPIKGRYPVPAKETVALFPCFGDSMVPAAP